MIFIPFIEDRSEPIEFEAEEWESGQRGRAAAEREVAKALKLIHGVQTPDKGLLAAREDEH